MELGKQFGTLFCSEAAANLHLDFGMAQVAFCLVIVEGHIKEFQSSKISTSSTPYLLHRAPHPWGTFPPSPPFAPLSMGRSTRYELGRFAVLHPFHRAPVQALGR